MLIVEWFTGFIEANDGLRQKRYGRLAGLCEGPLDHVRNDNKHSIQILRLQQETGIAGGVDAVAVN